MKNKTVDAKIIEDYTSGMSWDAICAKYSCSTYDIHNILKQNGIKKNRVENSSWSEDKRQLFVKMYLSNATYKEMYAALDCKGGTLTYWVHKLHLPMRGSGRNNTCPNKFLERTPESDYWLGYIFADGHIDYCPDKRRFTVGLHSSSKEVIEKFKEWFGPEVHIYQRSYKIKSGETRYMYSGLIGSKEVAFWFYDFLGISGKKHHTLNPKIDLTWDILRGYFDGDGCAYKGWSVKSCSTEWLGRIKDFLSSYGIKSYLCRSYLDCYCLSVENKHSLSILVPLLYQNPYFCHIYKYKHFEPYMSNHVMKTE